jgi:hypothetical protein
LIAIVLRMCASIWLARNAGVGVHVLVAHPTGTELGLTSGLPAAFALANERTCLRDLDLTGVGQGPLRGTHLTV